MLVSDKSAATRLNSPMNLINRLRRENDNSGKRKSAMSLFIKPEKKIEEKIDFNPFKDSKLTEPLSPSTSSELSAPQTENLDSILKNNESQIKLGLAHDKALELLNRSVDMLSNKLDEVSASKLPSVISAASKTVESIRRERLEQSKTSDREVHYHFYTPEQKSVSQYEVIDVTQ